MSFFSIHVRLRCKSWSKSSRSSSAPACWFSRALSKRLLSRTRTTEFSRKACISHRKIGQAPWYQSGENGPSVCLSPGLLKADSTHLPQTVSKMVGSPGIRNKPCRGRARRDGSRPNDRAEPPKLGSGARPQRRRPGRRGRARAAPCCRVAGEANRG